MSLRRWYPWCFLAGIVAALALAFTLDVPNKGVGLVLIMGCYGIGMYFQGRWHESEGGKA